MEKSLLINASVAGLASFAFDKYNEDRAEADRYSSLIGAAIVAAAVALTSFAQDIDGSALRRFGPAGVAGAAYYGVTKYNSTLAVDAKLSTTTTAAIVAAITGIGEYVIDSKLS